ncbi:hypothetical protein Xvie_03698 [Xenorhabdus vietnamensis]|uniref:DUF2829 domain-containing protein n=1 Tax=Xenorhabdus vietnamensis TaxID=351656 RepID=A0A1Y2S7A7_9GAMM|nr:DUF2829 domain-containing protein [Xenorhabdus vietnamensis]OTA14477.1 hypothetical protein Xvie_03698 [Xenorhabdus vietnamensis]
MSDVINPEHECPFDPKHYQCDCFIAPVGSFSWALIQLKLRKRVTRSVWVNCQGNNEMYLAITPRVNNLAVEEGSAYAVDGVAVGTQYDYLTHIDLRNEHGNFVPWQPTQEDMMACDWGFVEEEKKEESVKPETESKPEPTLEPTPELKPETPKYNLVFDATSKEAGINGNLRRVDKPIIIENNLTTNGSLYCVYWFTSQYGTSAANQLELQFEAVIGLQAYVPDLRNKTLIITVDDKKYNLGTLTEVGTDSRGHEVHIHYRDGDTKEIGKLLEQEGKTYRFHCEWYD